MRNIILFAVVIGAAAASPVVVRGTRAPEKFPQAQIAQQQQTAQPPPAQASAQSAAPPLATEAPAHFGPVIVLNPAHGATDTGARGENGIFEKDLVLEFAMAARAELQRQGYRVVMTRNDDSNPSYDDRAGIADAFRDFIFVSFHVSSTGTPGTARTYFYQFWNPFTIPQSAPSAAQDAPNAAGKNVPPAAKPVAAPPHALIPWEEAQRPDTEASHRLADILQADLAQHFPGSPAVSSGAEVRDLRSVTGPAIDVEISSVAVTDANSLRAMAAPLAAAIARSIAAFHPSSAAGGK
ncbi:MAG: N-acetylmuramoyl-L-alanine amidase family protein [Candidatus Acidiferrales bacterium]